MYCVIAIIQICRCKRKQILLLVQQVQSAHSPFAGVYAVPTVRGGGQRGDRESRLDINKSKVQVDQSLRETTIGRIKNQIPFQLPLVAADMFAQIKNCFIKRINKV